MRTVRRVIPGSRWSRSWSATATGRRCWPRSTPGSTACAEHGVEVLRVSVPDAPGALAAYMTLTSFAALAWLEPYVASGLAGEELLRRHDYAARAARARPGHPGRGCEPAAPAARPDRRGPEARGRARLPDDADVRSPAPRRDHAGGPGRPAGRPYTDCWTVVANLAGVPALSVPCPTDGLPVGAMLMGGAGRDSDLLALAAALLRRLLLASSPPGRTSTARR